LHHLQGVWNDFIGKWYQNDMKQHVCNSFGNMVTLKHSAN
jgi:hypothetical protein